MDWMDSSNIAPRSSETPEDPTNEEAAEIVDDDDEGFVVDKEKLEKEFRSRRFSDFLSFKKDPNNGVKEYLQTIKISDKNKPSQATIMNDLYRQVPNDKKLIYLQQARDEQKSFKEKLIEKQRKEYYEEKAKKGRLTAKKERKKNEKASTSIEQASNSIEQSSEQRETYLGKRKDSDKLVHRRSTKSEAVVQGRRSKTRTTSQEEMEQEDEITKYFWTVRRSNNSNGQKRSSKRKKEEYVPRFTVNGWEIPRVQYEKDNFSYETSPVDADMEIDGGNNEEFAPPDEPMQNNLSSKSNNIESIHDTSLVIHPSLITDENNQESGRTEELSTEEPLPPTEKAMQLNETNESDNSPDYTSLLTTIQHILRDAAMNIATDRTLAARVGENIMHALHANLQRLDPAMLNGEVIEQIEFYQRQIMDDGAEQSRRAEAGVAADLAPNRSL